MSEDHRIGIHIRTRWKHLPWRWIKVVNEDTGQTAYCWPFGHALERALDKVHEG